MPLHMYPLFQALLTEETIFSLLCTLGGRSAVYGMFIFEFSFLWSVGLLLHSILTAIIFSKLREYVSSVVLAPNCVDYSVMFVLL